MDLPQKTEFLEVLYKIAVDEYRFQVKLNWERMKFYLSLNLILLGLGTGLLNLKEPSRFNSIIAVFFLVAAICCIVGVLAILKGHSYYRLTIYKKTLIEDLLNLHPKIKDYPSKYANLSLVTTPGMINSEIILKETDDWLQRSNARPGTVVFYVNALLLFLAVLNLGCAIFVLFQAFPIQIV